MTTLNALGFVVLFIQYHVKSHRKVFSITVPLLMSVSKAKESGCLFLLRHKRQGISVFSDSFSVTAIPGRPFQVVDEQFSLSVSVCKQRQHCQPLKILHTAKKAKNSSSCAHDLIMIFPVVAPQIEINLESISEIHMLLVSSGSQLLKVNLLHLPAQDLLLQLEVEEHMLRCSTTYVMLTLGLVTNVDLI